MQWRHGSNFTLKKPVVNHNVPVQQSADPSFSERYHQAQFHKADKQIKNCLASFYAKQKMSGASKAPSQITDLWSCVDAPSQITDLWSCVAPPQITDLWSSLVMWCPFSNHWPLIIFDHVMPLLKSLAFDHVMPLLKSLTIDHVWMSLLKSLTFVDHVWMPIGVILEYRRHAEDDMHLFVLLDIKEDLIFWKLIRNQLKLSKLNV